MLTKTMNPLQELIAVGADAQAGLYDIDINIPGGDIAAQQLRVRNAGFKAPETSQDIYQVKYKGATLTRPKASLNIGQTFEVQCSCGPRKPYIKSSIWIRFFFFAC